MWPCRALCALCFPSFQGLIAYTWVIILRKMVSEVKHLCTMQITLCPWVTWVHSPSHTHVKQFLSQKVTLRDRRGLQVKRVTLLLSTEVSLRVNLFMAYVFANGFVFVCSPRIHHRMIEITVWFIAEKEGLGAGRLVLVVRMLYRLPNSTVFQYIFRNNVFALIGLFCMPSRVADRVFTFY